MGGTSTLARILQVKLGIPISATPFYTDLAIMLAAGVVFGWEAALNALVALFVSGFAVDYVLEGPSVIRSATIITDKADAVLQAILTDLGRGVTLWQGEGGYTGHQHAVLFVTVARPEAAHLRAIVSAADPQAFIVITQGQAAYGKGFKTIQH